MCGFFRVTTDLELLRVLSASMNIDALEWQEVGFRQAGGMPNIGRAPNVLAYCGVVVGGSWPGFSVLG